MSQSKIKGDSEQYERPIGPSFDSLQPSDLAEISFTQLKSAADPLTLRIRASFDPEFQKELCDRCTKELGNNPNDPDAINLGLKLLIRAPVRTPEIDKVAEAVKQCDLSVIPQMHRQVKALAALARFETQHPQHRQVIDRAVSSLANLEKDENVHKNKIRVHLRSLRGNHEGKKRARPNRGSAIKEIDKLETLLNNAEEGKLGVKNLAKAFSQASRAQDRLNHYSAKVLGRALEGMRERIEFMRPQESVEILREMSRLHLYDREVCAKLLDASLNKEAKEPLSDSQRISACEYYTLCCSKGEDFDISRCRDVLFEISNSSEHGEMRRARGRMLANTATLIATSEGAEDELFKAALKTELSLTLEELKSDDRLHIEARGALGQSQLERLVLASRILGLDVDASIVGSLTQHALLNTEIVSNFENQIMELIKPLEGAAQFSQQVRLEGFPWLHVDILARVGTDLTVIECDGPSHICWDLEGNYVHKRGLDRLREAAFALQGYETIRIGFDEYNHTPADTLRNSIANKLKLARPDDSASVA